MLTFLNVVPVWGFSVTVEIVLAAVLGVAIQRRVIGTVASRTVVQSISQSVSRAEIRSRWKNGNFRG